MGRILGLALVFAVAVGAFADDVPPGPSVGGKHDVAIDDPAVHELLKANIERLVTGDGTALELIAITKITKQVVAGSKYEISGSFKHISKPTDCVIVIWHRAWLEDASEKTKLKADCGSQHLATKSDDGSW